MRNGHKAREWTIEEPVCLLVKYLWMLIVLPKAIQFFILVGLALYVLIRARDKVLSCVIPFPVLFILAGVFVHLFSIVCQCFSTTVDMSRLGAAINTALIWLVACIFFMFSWLGNWDKCYCERLYKYALIDLAILFVVFVISLFIKSNVIPIGGYSLVLRRFDYLASGTTMRFAGLMETVLGPGHLFCILAPLVALYGRSGRNRALLSIGLLTADYYVVVQTHSRIGLLVCGIVYIIAAFYICCTIGTYKVLFRVAACVLAVSVIAVAVGNINEIESAISDLFGSRAGSNNARFDIYSKSIEMAATQSPIIGMGVKYMLGDFPYGSHCTYIGFFYKTGVLGFCLFMVGLLGFYRFQFKAAIAAGAGRSFALIGFCYLGYLLFADLDACNWIIVLAFSLWGILCKTESVGAFLRDV